MTEKSKGRAAFRNSWLQALADPWHLPSSTWGPCSPVWASLQAGPLKGWRGRLHGPLAFILIV